MNLNIKEEFKDRIDEIWNDATNNNISKFERGYAITESLEQSSLLFIGVNPSFEEDKKYEPFYKNTQRESHETHSYYKKFQDISSKLKNIRWDSIDLFFVRETNQKNVKNLIDSTPSKDFMDRQLKLSLEIIELSKPLVIVVASAFAKEFFKQRFETKFDNNIGTHKVTNTSIKGVPVFFTSMLNGQRALDLGSYERLIWHINYVLENSK